MRLSIEFDILDETGDLPDEVIADVYATARERVETFLNGPDDDDNTLAMAQAAKLLHTTSSAYAEEVEKEVTDTIVHYLQTALEVISVSRLTLAGEPTWDVKDAHQIH